MEHYGGRNESPLQGMENWLSVFPHSSVLKAVAPRASVNVLSFSAEVGQTVAPRGSVNVPSFNAEVGQTAAQLVFPHSTLK